MGNSLSPSLTQQATLSGMASKNPFMGKDRHKEFGLGCISAGFTSERIFGPVYQKQSEYVFYTGVSPGFGSNGSQY